jgi:Phosphotransferase enzyme family
VRQISEHRDESQHLVYHTYLLENHSGAWLPPDPLHWIGAEQMAEVMLSHPARSGDLLRVLQEIASGSAPPQRALWEQPGWLRLAEAWIHSQLAQLGNPASGQLEQVKHWFLSCIWRIPTAQGWVYFKATNGSALMVNEAALTQTLFQLFPAVMPQPLASDPARDWLLLADFGSEIGWEASVETRAAALTAFAHLQIASVSHVDELLAYGCINRRLPQLTEQIKLLLNDPAMLAMIDAEQQQVLQAAIPRLAELCRQMACYNVPATLVHGDIHMSNVARRGDGFVFFDWSDACIAHPFLDMIAILHEPDPATQIQLRDAYLANWTRYEPMERLLELWQLAYPLCALHQAVSYRAIAQHVEGGCNHPMISWAMPFWFGKILAASV